MSSRPCSCPSIASRRGLELRDKGGTGRHNIAALCRPLPPIFAVMHDTLYFTDHHFQVRDMVRDFAQQVVKPSARRYDLASQFPWDNVRQMADLDRKSTRLNSSHTVISYAVFCLKKKK